MTGKSRAKRKARGTKMFRFGSSGRDSTRSQNRRDRRYQRV